MEILTIDAPMLAKMFLAGAKNLESKKEWINELNVFPVPDGDTGTNMDLSMTRKGLRMRKNMWSFCVRKPQACISFAGIFPEATSKR